MEFIEQDDSVIFVWDDHNRPPFEERVLGAFRQNHDGYYEFHGCRKLILNCKQCLRLSLKLSELNTERS